VVEIDNKLEELGEEEETEETPVTAMTPKSSEPNDGSISSEDQAMDASFMSESIYQKLPSPKGKRHRSISMIPRIIVQ
jgi:hypothetical protein